MTTQLGTPLTSGSSWDCVLVSLARGLSLLIQSRNNLIITQSVTDVKGGNIHLVGHSLGSHLMVGVLRNLTFFLNFCLMCQGKAGRTYAGVTSEKIGRISGLDPAGPRSVIGQFRNTEL